MARPPGERDEERRRLFRRMEWVFVYLPPFLALLVAASGAALVAWAIPLAGTSFWQRWLTVAGALLVIPLTLYLLREWWTQRK